MKLRYAPMLVAVVLSILAATRCVLARCKGCAAGRACLLSTSARSSAREFSLIVRVRPPPSMSASAAATTAGMIVSVFWPNGKKTSVQTGPNGWLSFDGLIQSEPDKVAGTKVDYFEIPFGNDTVETVDSQLGLNVAVRQAHNGPGGSKTYPPADYTATFSIHGKRAESSAAPLAPTVDIDLLREIVKEALPQNTSKRPAPYRASRNLTAARNQATKKQKSTFASFFNLTPAAAPVVVPLLPAAPVITESWDEIRKRRDEKEKMVASYFGISHWPPPKAATRLGKKPDSDHYKVALHQYTRASAKLVTVTPDGDLNWPAGGAARKPPAQCPAGFKKGMVISQAFAMIDDAENAKRKRSEQASSDRADGTAPKPKQKRASPFKKSIIQAYFDFARSPTGIHLLSKTGGKDLVVAHLKDTMPHMFPPSFSKSAPNKWVVKRWDDPAVLNPLVDEENERFGPVNILSALGRNRDPDDPFDFDSYRRVLPAPVLFAFLSLLEGYQKTVSLPADSHLPCVVIQFYVIYLVANMHACTLQGFPANSTTLQPAFHGIVRGMGHGHLIAERDETRPANDKHRYSYTNSEGKVVNQILLDQRWINRFCQDVNFTMRVANRDKAKPHDPDVLASTKLIFQQRLAWLVTLFNIPLFLCCNLDETGVKLLQLPTKGRAEKGSSDVAWVGVDDKRMFTSVPVAFGDGTLLEPTQLLWAGAVYNATDGFPHDPADRSRVLPDTHPKRAGQPIHTTGKLPTCLPNEAVRAVSKDFIDHDWSVYNPFTFDTFTAIGFDTGTANQTHLPTGPRTTGLTSRPSSG